MREWKRWWQVASVVVLVACPARQASAQPPPAPETPAPEAPAVPPAPARAPRASIETPSAEVPPAPPSPPPLPRDVLPTGWFGFAIECFPCSGDREPGATHPVWSFGEAPRVYHVEPGSPAARAGLAKGDVLTHMDGVALTTREGGVRFGAVKPGERVTWQVRRGGERLTMPMTAGVRWSHEAPPAPDAPRAPQALRYAARFGDSDIEVRGAASVIISEDEREIVITSDGVTVRLRKRHD